MFLTSEMPADQPKLASIKLIVPRELALRRTQELFLEGRQINALYICTHEELETANQRKRSWISQTTDYLSTLCDTSDAADYFDQISINVLKDSAPIESLTELFHNEINQRLERLRTIRKAVEDSAVPEPAVQRAPSSPSSEPREERSLLSLDDIAIPSPSALMASLQPPTPAAPRPVRKAAPVPSEVLINLQATPAPKPDAPRPAPAPRPVAAAPTSVVAPRPAPAPAAFTPTVDPPAINIPTMPIERAKVIMILCSRNGTARQALCRFANKMNMNFDIVDYNIDQPHSIVEQIYRHRDAKFAIVYWGDPGGRELPGSAHPERYAGFTLGFALGRLGRGRVFILGSTTTPPLPGFTRILVAQLDASGGWQIQLARRMKAAGLDIDMNKLS